MSRRSRRAATGPRYSVAVTVVVASLGTALAVGAGVSTFANASKGKLTSLEQIAQEEQVKAESDRTARPDSGGSSGADGSDSKKPDQEKPAKGDGPGESRNPGQGKEPGKGDQGSAKPTPGKKPTPGTKPTPEKKPAPGTAIDLTAWPKTKAQRVAMRKNPKPFAQSQAAKRGWTGVQMKCLDHLWTKESGWKYNAKDADTEAYGIAQALPAWRMKSAGADWKTNPATQIVWGLGYIKERHKSPCLAWEHHKQQGWY